MAQSLDDGEFWLPPEFLTDDDFLMEKASSNKDIKSNSGNGVGIGTDGSNCLSFYEFPFGLGDFGFSLDLRSPIESVVGSTGTESDEEDYIAGLTRQIAQSTLEDDSASNNNLFCSDNTRLNTARFSSRSASGWGLSGSPQSTLFPAGIRCSCRQLSSQSSQSRDVQSAAVWDTYFAAAEKVGRIRRKEDSFSYDYCRGPLCSPRKHFAVPVAAENANLGGGYESNPSLSYQKLQATQQLKQQYMTKGRAKQSVQNTGKVNHSSRPLGLSASAWPTLQHAQQNQRTGSGMRAMFLGNQMGKRECAGTGVFLPRGVTATSPAVTRKKPALSTVLIPARVVQALKLDLNDTAVAHPPDISLKLDNYASLSVRNGNVYGNQKRGSRPSDPAVTHELPLPPDWSY